MTAPRAPRVARLSPLARERRRERTNRRWFLSTLERTAATYVQSFLGLLLARPTFDVNLPTLKVAAISALPAALAVVKAAAARHVGDTGTASLVAE